MPRRVFISCLPSQSERAGIKEICLFMRDHEGIVEFAPSIGEWDFSRLMEEAIERCDVFVTPEIYSGATWMAHARSYAQILRQMRAGGKRPRIFALSIGGDSSSHKPFNFAIEWLTEQTYDLLLHDMTEEQYMALLESTGGALDIPLVIVERPT